MKISSFLNKKFILKILPIIFLIGIIILLLNQFKNMKEGFKEGEKNKKDENKKLDDKQEFKCSNDKDCSKGKKCINGICNVPSSSPASVDNKTTDDMNVAAKIEDAYSNLNKVLGEDGMKGMATETKKLVAQQKELMSTLNDMAPSLNKAKETLENLNLPSMNEMTDILKKFNQ